MKGGIKGREEEQEGKEGDREERIPVCSSQEEGRSTQG